MKRLITAVVGLSLMLTGCSASSALIGAGAIVGAEIYAHKAEIIDYTKQFGLNTLILLSAYLDPVPYDEHRALYGDGKYVAEVNNYGQRPRVRWEPSGPSDGDQQRADKNTTSPESPEIAGGTSSEVQVQELGADSGTTEAIA